MKTLFVILLFFPVLALSTSELKPQLSVAPRTFEFERNGEKILMQQYFIVFLKSGPNRSQNQEEAAELQKQHLAYLGKLYENGIIQLNGPTNGEDEIRGFSVYATATISQALQYANADPMVKAGRLVVEARAWWLAKGSRVK